MNEEQMRAEFEAWWANFQSYHEDWMFADKEAILFQAWQAALSAKSVPEADEATTELRVVYEAARKFLRYNGVDKDKVNQAVDELDEAIEAVKHIDGGYKDFPLEAALQVPTNDERVRELERDTKRLDFLCNGDFIYWIHIQTEPHGNDLFQSSLVQNFREAIDAAMKEAGQ